MTIQEQIEKDRKPYYAALENADGAWAAGTLDLTAMKNLLGTMLARQLYALHQDAGMGGA